MGIIVPDMKNTFTKTDLLRDFRALGIREGMKLQVHSSLSALGWIDGGADAVLDALQEILTPEGTLMLPSFNHQKPYDEGKIYDVRETPTTNGIIPDTFWRRSDVVRGINPTHPFAAWGKNASYYVSHDQEAPTMGVGSPLYRLCRDGGYVLLLGVGYRANTFHHVAETLSGAPCLNPAGEAYPVIGSDGKTFRAHTWSWRGGRCPVSTEHPLYESAMADIETRGKVGDGEAILYPMQEGLLRMMEVFKPHCANCPVRPRVCQYSINNR